MQFDNSIKTVLTFAELFITDDSNLSHALVLLGFPLTNADQAVRPL